MREQLQVTVFERSRVRITNRWLTAESAKPGTFRQVSSSYCCPHCVHFRTTQAYILIKQTRVDALPANPAPEQGARMIAVKTIA